MSSPFCSIIVLNYEGEKFLAQTIDSLLALDYPKNRYEIIVVDNASTDRSREIIHTLAHSISPSLTSQVKSGPSVYSISLQKNVGFAAGNNVGIKEAKGKYVALLNNDCTVDKDWLSELISVIEKDDQTFAVNSKIYLANTNKIQNAGIKIFSNGYAQDRGAVPKNKIQDYEEDKDQYDKEEEVDAAFSAAVLYRRSILDKIGLFNEDFFLYYEDVEISQRAKKKEYKIMYAPHAKAYHIHAVSSKEWSPFFIYHSEKGRLLHVLLHFPFSVFIKEFAIFSIRAKMRFFIRLFTNPKSTPKNWQYLRVRWYFIFNLPLLLFKKTMYEKNSRHL